MSDDDRVRLLASLYAAWEDALGREMRTRAAFVEAALEDLRASGRGAEAAVWRAAAALGEEAPGTGTAAAYLAGQLGLTPTSTQEDADAVDDADATRHP